MLTAEQLEQRKTGIGGSDVAAILGLSKWKTQHELYLEKRGEIEPAIDPTEEPEYLHFGNVLEDVIAKEFERRNDLKVRRRNQHFQHKDFPFMQANIDRSVDGLQAVLECKTAGAFMVSEWGPSGGDEFPDYYRVQLDHYMNVLGYKQGYLSVLIGGNQYRQYYVEQDAELSEIIMEACIKFWERVEKGDPPDIDFDHRSTEGMLKRMYAGTNGKTIVLPNQIAHWHAVKQMAEATIKENEAVVQACKNRISAAMGDAAVGTLPDLGYQYKRSLTKRKAFTVEASEFMVLRGSTIRGKK